MDKKMERKADCKSCRSHLADLLLDESYISVHPEIAVHMAECSDCRTELEELQATVALLDTWAAPEPSAYFDVKLRAKLREAQAAGPEGLWNRMRSFLLFSTGRRLRPALAAALVAAVMLGGGGTFAGFYERPRAVAVKASPAVNDLRLMDNNAQALQQMDQLLNGSDDSSAPPNT